MPSRNVPVVTVPVALGPPPHTAFLGALLRAVEQFSRAVATRLNAGPFHLAEYTTATRPAASQHPGGLIYVSDAGAGNLLQYSDGASWIPYA